MSALDPKASPRNGYATVRRRLLQELRDQGISDERVLAAIDKVPRHNFVEDTWRNDAYKNKSLPIGNSQTISQPYVVAFMSQLVLAGRAYERVLEVGTGSGYQTAVLAELVKTVFSVERIKSLSEQARARLRTLGYRNIHFGYTDGNEGWAAHAPYDTILVTAAAGQVPDELLAQLDRRGRLIIPVGPSGAQSLQVIDRAGGALQCRDVLPVSFVPLRSGRE